MTDYDKLYNKIESYIKQGKTFKVVLSKPRKDKSLKKIVFTQFNLGQGLKHKAVENTKTQAFTNIYEADEVLDVIAKGMNDDYFFADFFSQEEEITLMQSKKGKQTLITKKGKSEVKLAEQHDKKKNYLVAEDSRYLQLLGISSSKGQVHAKAQKKYRQINKFVENINALVQEDLPGIVIDMGSGKGYLTFALYDLLSRQNPAVKVTGYEIREDIVHKCNEVAKACGFTGLTFEVKDISSTETKGADMIIALHACDIATDMALEKGIKGSSKYIVVAPCCHKQVRKDMEHKDAILRHGILAERQAEIVTDAMRVLLLESKGYETKIFEFIDAEHTAKNLMITAKSGAKPVDITHDINDLKQRVGLKEHYLEKLLTS